MKKRKFDSAVARFFHPEKSISDKPKFTHQNELAKEKSCIIVYSGKAPYRKPVE